MEISDRRYQELLESIAIEQGRLNVVRFARRTARELALSLERESKTTQIEHQWADLPTALASVTREVKEILLVDPEADRLVAAQSFKPLESDYSPGHRTCSSPISGFKPLTVCTSCT
jgi:hypothetical protein